MFAPRQGRSSRSLRFEKFEDRTLLAFAAFAVNLYQDVGGQPGPIIASDTVHAGDSFFVEITAEDLLAQPRGLGGVSLHIAWDPNILREVDANFDPHALITSKLPVFPFGTLEQEAGRIDDLSGQAALAWGVGDVIGLDGPERFAMLHFQALDTSGSSPFALGGGSHGISHFPPVWGAAGKFTFENQTITVVPRPIDADPVISLLSTSNQVISSVQAANHPSLASGQAAVDNSEPANSEPVRVEAPTPEQEGRAAGIVIQQHEDFVTIEFAAPLQPETPDAAEGEAAPASTAAVIASASPVSASPVSDGLFSHACFSTPAPHKSAPLAEPSLAVSQRETEAGNRAASFIGPLLPHEYATRLILAELGSQLASLVNPHRLDEALVDVLVIDWNSQHGPFTR